MNFNASLKNLSTRSVIAAQCVSQAIMKPQRPSTKKSTYTRRRRQNPAAGSGAASTGLYPGGAAAAIQATGGFLPIIMNGGLPFEARKICRLRYAVCNNNTLTTGTAGVFGSVTQYRLNSLYDPELTAAGHQPYYYDQMTAIYGKYKVRAVRVSVTFTTPGATADILACIHIASAENFVSISGLLGSDALERPGIVPLRLSSSGNRACAYQFNSNISTVLGMTRSQFMSNTEECAAAYNANPARVAVMEIGIASFTAQAAEAAAYCLQFEFDCEFFDRYDVSGS